MERKRLVVAITGATGAIFGIRLLERVREFDVETHLIISGWGARTIEHETPYTAKEVRALSNVSYAPNEQGAAISSGSFQTTGMVIAPCSVKTLAGIAIGFGGDLVTRAADVTIKERRSLLLMVRESPLSAIHLENMQKLAALGVTIMPPLPAFYNHPVALDDAIDHIILRTLDQFGLVSKFGARWDGKMQTRHGDRDENGIDD